MQPDERLFPELDQPRLAQIFVSELKGFSWSRSLEPFYSRLCATEKSIVEALDGRQLFSDALWDLCFTQFAMGEYWHYTTLEKLGGIVRTNEIWLYALSKRMGECELTSFAAEFDYDGLLAVEEDGYRRVDKLARDLFFLSLTDEETPGDMWGYGEVRLRLKVAPILQRATLTKMSYRAAADHPLKVLKEFASRRFDRRFVPWQVSRQGAFFLNAFYSWESEVRLLIKRFEANTDLSTRQSEDGEAIAIPIGKENSRVLIDLVGIEAETVCAKREAENLLADAEWSKVPCATYEVPE